MAATFGRIDEFEEGKEDWTQYIERLEHFFVANSATDNDKKRSILLTVMGPSAYKLLRSLMSPAKPGDKSFEELVTAMKLHHNPAPSVIVQRYKFNSRFRREGESVAKFVSELRSLSEFCNYGPTLDDMLRDRLVCGVNDDHIQRRLLAEEKLTFQKAMEVAVAMETAASNARMLQGSAMQPASRVSDGDVHKVQSSGKLLTAAVACYRCGKSNHLAQQCRFKTVKCHGCGKIGHIVKVCRSTALKNPRTSVGAGTQEVQHLQVGVSDDAGEVLSEEYSLCNVRSEPETPLKVRMGINKQQVEMEVDTGPQFVGTGFVAAYTPQLAGDFLLTKNITIAAHLATAPGCFQRGAGYNERPHSKAICGWQCYTSILQGTLSSLCYASESG